MLRNNQLVTVRYADPKPFKLFERLVTRPTNNVYTSGEKVMLGLIEATSLAFLEVGLCEDRERARDLERRRGRAPEHVEPPRLGRWRGRLRRRGG